MKNGRLQFGFRLLTLGLLLFSLMSAPTARAAIAQRGTATTANTTGTTLTILKPTGVVAGDVMIVNISNPNQNSTAASSSGWSSIASLNLGGGDAYATLLYKVAGGSEPSSYAFTLGSSGGVGGIVAFSGVDTSGATPFDVAPGTVSTANNSTTATGTSITTVSANAAVIMFGMVGAASPTWSGWTTATSPGALTELYDAQVTGGSVGAGSAIKASAGTTGAGSATLSASGRTGGILIALKPYAGDASHSTISPATATKTANGSDTQVVTVQARNTDNSNYSLGGASVVFSASAGTMSATTDNGNGTYTATWTAPTSVGSGTATITATLNATSVGTAVGASSCAITLQPGPVSKLAITSVNSGSNPTAGTGFNVVVQSQDANGNAANVAANTGVTLSLNTGNGTLGGTLSGTINSGSSSVTISGVTYTKAESGVILTATRTSGDSLTAGNSASFTVNAGAANKLAFTTQPGGGTGGTAWTTQPTVTLQDAFGNTVTGTAQSVTLAIQNNAGGGALSGTTTVSVNTGTGVATFSGLSINKVGTGYTLTATGSTVSTTPGVVVSSAFNITTGTATKLAITSVNGGSNPTAGTGFSVTVQSQDAGGNVANVTSSTGVSLARTTGTGTLGGTTTGTINNGTSSITISGVTYTKAESGVVLTASRTSGMTLTAGASSPFTVDPGAVDAAHSTISPATASITANGTSTQAITVQARDVNNNNRTTGGDTVVFSLSGPGSISGTTDNGNGTYTATVTSATALGAGTVTATLGGTAVGTAVSASSSVVSYALGVTSLATVSSNTVGTTLVMTLPAGVPVGNTVILSFAMDPNTGSITATDTQGNTYTVDNDNNVNSGATTGVRTVVLSAHITTALVSGNTITITHPSVLARAASACYASGLVSVSRVDKTAVGGSTTAASSGNTASATTLYADELLIGAVGIENSSTTFTAGGSFTALSTAAANGGSAGTSIAILPEYRIVSATGSYSAGTPSWTSSRWSAVLVTYRTPNISTPTSIGTGALISAGTTVTNIVPAGGVSVGNTIIVTFAMDPANGAVSVADTGGNSYTSDVSRTNGPGTTTGVRTHIFSARVTTALASGDKIIVTHPSVTARAMSSFYVNGLVSASMVDQTAGATGNSTTPSSGATAATAQPDELVIGAMGTESKTSTDTMTAGGTGTYTLLPNASADTGTSGTSITIFPEYQIVGATGAQTASGTIGNSRNWAAAVVTYKMLGGVEPSHSTISPATASITANGTSTQVITVQARDGYDNNITTGGEAVTLALTSGTGTIGATTDNGNGTYTATVTSPTTVGSGTVTATINGDSAGTAVSASSSIVTYIPGPAHHITITSSTANLTSGGTRAITAEIRDANNNVVTSDSSTSVNFTQTAGTGSVSGTGSATASSGIASKTVTGVTAGSVTLTASASGLTSGTTTFSVVAGVADHITITSSTANLSSGSARSITAEIRDANNNVVTSDSSTSVSFAQTAGTGSVSGTGLATASSGIASKTVTGVTAGSVTLTASASGLTSGTTTFSVVAGAADHITITSSTANLSSGSTRSITAEIRDANNNVVTTDSSSSVNFAQTAGTGSVSGTGSATAASGIASKTVTGVTAGSVTLTASASGMTSGTTTFSVVAGAADHLTITSSTADLSSGSTRSITAEIRDANNNVVTTDSSSSVSFSQTAGSGSVSGTGSATASSGIASKTVTGVNAGSVTLTASASGMTSGTTTFSVVAGSADHITITSSTANLSSGSTRSITAEIRDANNNVVTTDSSSSVSFSQTAGSGSVSGTGSATASSGIASKTVTGVTAGSVTLTASASGLTSGTTTFSVVVGAADHITITSSTADLSSGSTRAITAEIRDANNNVVTSDSSTSVNFAQTAGTGSVSGTGSATASSGIASKTVTGVTAGSVTLTASAGGLTSGTTTFSVVVGAADHITITSSTADLSSGSTRSITAEIRDANNNVVTSDSSTSINFTQTTGTGSVSGTGSATASSGIASKTVTGVTAGSVTLTASASGLTSGTTTFSVVVGAADHITITSSTADLSSGSTRSITAEIRDANNNVVTSDSSTSINFAQTTGTGSVSGTGSATASSGIASKTVTGVTAGSVTLTASASGLTSGTTTFSVVSSAASAYRITAANATVTPGVGEALTIELVDASGNTVSSFNGDTNLTFSGVAPGETGTSTNATVTDKDSVAIDLGQTTTMTFTNGVSAGTLVAYKAQTNVTLNVTDGSLSSTDIGGEGLELTVTNANPLAPARTFARAPLTSLKIAVSELLTSVTDANKDSVTLDSVGSASGGATVTKNSTYVFYTPNGAGDGATFDYTVSDGHGGTDTGTVTINVAAQGGHAQSIVSSGGTVTITFFGVPGIQYNLQRAATVNGTYSTIAGPQTANANDGHFTFTDTPGAGTFFYRSIQN